MVITNVNQVVYQGDGVTTAFQFTFQIIDSTDLKLTLINAAGARTDITSDYYVDMVNSTVYYPGYAPGAEPPEANQPPKVQSGEKLEIYRRVPVNQLADLGEKWPFNVIEKGLDKLTMICQDIYSWIGRNIVGLTEDGTAWDARNLPISNVGGPVSVEDAATKDYVDRILNGFVLEGDSRTVPFDNVAQMLAADLEVGQISFTLGYYDIGDGGHGVYNIRSKTPYDVDDGGSIIFLDNDNVAELVSDGIVNIKQFGAVGDGTTDDTTAFYNALNKGNIYVPAGTYSIDWQNIELTNKKITGELRSLSIIEQRNKNVAFAKLRTKNDIRKVTFKSTLNDDITDVLHFGYDGVSYKSFKYTELFDVDFIGNNYSIPIHFNIQFGGNGNCQIHNVKITDCYIGMWFEFKKNLGNLQWMTDCVFENIVIVNPALYGLRWDAISMNGQGDIVDGQRKQTMWCYANRFESISVDLEQNGATGFKVGPGMSILYNPICFNDLVPPADADDEDYKAYSIEFAAINSPLQYKMQTWIIGGTLEGQIKNREYAYVNYITNLSLNLRNNFNSNNVYDVLDSKNIRDLDRMNLLEGAPNIASAKLYNATAEFGQDEGGSYIKVSRVSSSDDFSLRIDLTPQQITSFGYTGLATIITRSKSSTGSGGVYVTVNDYAYTVEGRAYEGRNINTNQLILMNYLDLAEEHDNGIIIRFGELTTRDIDWVKVYYARIVRGITGFYDAVEYVPNISLSNVSKRQEFTVSGETSWIEYTYPNVMEAMYMNSYPPHMIYNGDIPACTAGTPLGIGTISDYTVRTAVVFPIYNKSTRSAVGMMNISYDGVVTYHPEVTHGAITVFGSV